jgi:hypothetical protein
VTLLPIVTFVIRGKLLKIPAGILVTSSPNTTLLKFALLEKGLLVKLFKTLPFIVTLVKPRQPQKAHSPIDVTLLPIVILVKAKQLENAHPSINVTLFGIVTLIKPLQPLNAPYPISVTLFGMTRLVMVVKFANPWLAMRVTGHPVVVCGLVSGIIMCAAFSVPLLTE